MQPEQPRDTLGKLGGKRGGDGDKAVLGGAVVHWHLLSLPPVIRVAIALVHKLI